MTRPATLAATAERIRAGIASEIAIPEFLDTFYGASSEAEKFAILRDEPAFLNDARLDALLGAIGEYLSKQHRLGAVPAWTADRRRFLADPWFTTTSASDGMREFLTFSSPAEFAHRNIFTEAMPLRRASQLG